MSVNDGDWVEGEVKWWWKYVMPAQNVFWNAILAAKYRLDPEPSPWYQAVSGHVLEGLAMLNAAARIGKGAEADKLKAEGLAQIAKATAGVR